MFVHAADTTEALGGNFWQKKGHRGRLEVEKATEIRVGAGTSCDSSARVRQKKLRVRLSAETVDPGYEGLGRKETFCMLSSSDPLPHCWSRRG